MKETLKEYDLLLKVIEVSIPEPRPEDIAIQLEAIARDAEDFGSHVFWMGITRKQWIEIQDAIDHAMAQMAQERFERQMRGVQRAFAGDMRDLQRAHQDRLRQLDGRRQHRIGELYEQLHKENPDADPSE